jgi:hypothetical protein
MRHKRYFILGIFSIVLIVSGCTQQTTSEPTWVKELITNQINSPVANPPASLSKCTYKGDIVYYLPSRCCDITSVLYDKDGNVICSPDGGFTGSGDGRCPDFFNERKDCEIIWQDSRSYP